MKKLAVLVPVLSLLLTADTVKRPRILGVAHMALYVSDLAKSRAFYKEFLGFAEPYSLPRADGAADRIAFIKINEQQYIELFADPTRNEDGPLNHIAFYTDDARAMREYLAARGVKVPAEVGKGRIGNLNFTIHDPDGHAVEIVQYEPDSWTVRDNGKFLPDSRISPHMIHVGVTIQALQPSMNFYRDILGFQEIWRGGGDPKQLSWINLRVPDGTDYLEFMLYGPPPDATRRLTMNHICLVVPDIDKALQALEASPGRKAYGRAITSKVGVNGKRQANLYDPDGTRVELMEPNTFDGKPRPSSTAPPPRER